jgi:hypothetical protein
MGGWGTWRRSEGIFARLQGSRRPFLFCPASEHDPRRQPKGGQAKLQISGSGSLRIEIQLNILYCSRVGLLAGPQ